jgi:2'-5' RNA ligase
VRLFTAINFNIETRSRLIAIRDELRSQSTGGNFSLDENLHLTLAFIGECSPKKTDIIKAILESVTFDPFEATLQRLGTFSRGTLWWAGLAEDKPLMDLQREIEHGLIHSGFAMDERNYSPHITLGREVVTKIKPWAIEPFGETIKSIDLMKSERINGKMKYTAIFTKEATK